MEQQNDNRLFAELMGASGVMKQLRSELVRIAASDETVLIEGETGTGKTFAASLLHKYSARNAKPFRELNVAAIPDSIAEGELLGTAVGSFTGSTDRRGYFEQANGGTLLLDEIGNLSLAIQQKLLQLCESRIVYRLGSEKAIPIDVRLFSATNAPLGELRRAGLFRDDLYYRISTLRINIPPLRERISDIPLFAEPQLLKHQKLLSPEAYAKLRGHDWPGNVRELLCCVKRACAMSRTVCIGSCDITF